MDKKVQKFLRTIAQIESSGGKNVEHKQIDEGIHAGSSAYGKYGLMPNTIRELSNSEYGKTLPKELSKMEDGKIKEILKSNPQLEEAIAQSLYKKIQDRSTDPRDQAYMWNAGHNLTQDQLLNRDVENYPYVEKFVKEQGDDPDFQKQIPLADAVKDSSREFKFMQALFNSQREEPEIPFEDEEELKKLAKQ